MLKGGRACFTLSMSGLSKSLFVPELFFLFSPYGFLVPFSNLSLSFVVRRGGGVAVVCEFWLDLCWKIWVFLWIGFGILWVLVWIFCGFFGLDRRRRVAVASRISHVDSSSIVTVTEHTRRHGPDQAVI